MGDVYTKGVFSREYPLPLPPWNATSNVSESEQWALLERIAEQLPQADPALGGEQRAGRRWTRSHANEAGAALQRDSPEGVAFLGLARGSAARGSAGAWQVFLVQHSTAFKLRRRRYGRLGLAAWWLSSLAFTVLLTWRLKPLPLGLGASLFIFVGVATLLWFGAMLLTPRFRLLRGPHFVVPPSALALADALERLVAGMEDSSGN
jgi:hypothetical protein